METLTTRDYLEFRDRLIPAKAAFNRRSSARSRSSSASKIRCASRSVARGQLQRGAPRGGGSASSATKRVEARIADGPSLRHVLYDWLSRTPIGGSSGGDEGVSRFLETIVLAHKNEIGARLECAKRQALAPGDLEQLGRALQRARSP